MLQPERYQQVISALDNLYGQGLGWDETTKRLLLEEQQKTQPAGFFLVYDLIDSSYASHPDDEIYRYRNLASSHQTLLKQPELP